MRILMTATFCFPEGSLGASRALHMQAKGLAEAGHEVLVVVCHGSLGMKRADLDGFRVRSFALLKKGRGALRRNVSWLKGQLQMLGYLLNALRTREFDSIVFYGAAPVFALVAGIGARRRQQMTFVQGDVLDARAQPLLARAEVTLATRSALIVVGGSSLLAERLRKIAPATQTAQAVAADGHGLFRQGRCRSSKRTAATRGITFGRLRGCGEQA